MKLLAMTAAIIALVVFAAMRYSAENCVQWAADWETFDQASRLEQPITAEQYERATEAYRHLKYCRTYRGPDDGNRQAHR